jgi:hypothetical protein
MEFLTRNGSQNTRGRYCTRRLWESYRRDYPPFLECLEYLYYSDGFQDRDGTIWGIDYEKNMIGVFHAGIGNDTV